MLVHCRDTNFEPHVGDGIEGVVHRRAKDNKLQAYKVFSYYYYYSFLQPSFSIRYDGRAFLNRRGEQSGETGRAAGRGLDPQVAPRHRVSFAWNRIIFYCVARYHQLLEKRSWQSSPRSLSPTGFPLQPYPCSNLAGALRKGRHGRSSPHHPAGAPLGPFPEPTQDPRGWVNYSIHGPSTTRPPNPQVRPPMSP